MSAPSELQADALVQAVEQQVVAQRRTLLDEAEREAQAITERARDKVRRQLQRAVEEMRATESERRRQLQATLDTTARRRAASQARAQLDQAWPVLRAALARRWAEPSARAVWIESLLAQAAARLPATGWTVRHPAAWQETDLSTLRAALQHHAVRSPELRADAALVAGLVIEADGARLDGTPAALLADGERVEAALLAALHAASEVR